MTPSLLTGASVSRADPTRCLRTLRGQPKPCREPSETVGERMQGDGVGRDGATVDPGDFIVETDAGQVRKRRRDFALNRVVRRHVAGRIDSERGGEANEARVLARAIVVERDRSLAGSRQGVGRSFAERPMRPTFEGSFVAACFCEDRLGGGDVTLLAGVRGAGERNLVFDQAQPIRRAARNQRQGLQRLDRGTGVDWAVHIAEGEHGRAVRIYDDGRASMGRFDPLPTQDFDDDRVQLASLFKATFPPDGAVASPE